MVTIDHIGYVVADIERYLKDFAIPLFEPEAVSAIVEDPLQRVRVAFMTLQGGARIELIEPAGDTSPVSSFLKQKRGGLYHLCYAVTDLEREIARFRARGCFLISGPTPATAFNGRRVAFFGTRQNDIVELVERAEGNTGGAAAAADGRRTR